MDTVRANLSIDARADVGCSSAAAMGRTYERDRKKATAMHGDTGLDVANPLNITIPQTLLQNVLLDTRFHHGNELKRMLVFCTPRSKQALRQYSNELCIDGTFDVSDYIKYYT